jgi:hypothetical protein
METVVVKFSDAQGSEIDCGVNIDGQSSGRTFQKLMVQTGHHAFTLDTATAHTPGSVERLVQYTAPDDPDIVEFTAT